MEISSPSVLLKMDQDNQSVVISDGTIFFIFAFSF